MDKWIKYHQETKWIKLPESSHFGSNKTSRRLGAREEVYLAQRSSVSTDLGNVHRIFLERKMRKCKILTCRLKPP